MDKIFAGNNRLKHLIPLLLSFLFISSSFAETPQTTLLNAPPSKKTLEDNIKKFKENVQKKGEENKMKLNEQTKENLRSEKISPPFESFEETKQAVPAPIPQAAEAMPGPIPRNNNVTPEPRQQNPVTNFTTQPENVTEPTAGSTFNNNIYLKGKE